MTDKILVIVKKKNKEIKALKLAIGNFGTVNLGLCEIPIKELDIWLKKLYNYQLLSVKYRGRVIKFN